MFPINFNFPYRKKDGSIITMEKALDGAGADLDLIDLDDVAITNPADGDGLIYDNTAHKWKNIPIISRILTLFNGWKKNGAYNLCPNTASSTVGEGITYTVNSDGTVSAGGGVSVNNWGILITTGLKLRKGTYKLCGTPSGGNYDTTYSLYVSVGGVTVASDTPNTLGVTDTFTVSDETASYDVMLIIRGGIDLTTPITFKPMITTDLNATYADYVPYAMTNRELTPIKKTITTSTDANGYIDISAKVDEVKILSPHCPQKIVIPFSITAGYWLVKVLNLDLTVAASESVTVTYYTQKA